MLAWRNLVCGVMIVIVPMSLVAQSTGRALLYSDGGTWLNGSPAPATSAIFQHDFIQTQTGHNAKIDADGSTVMVLPETVVHFETDELVLDHGSLQLNTARGMKVRVNCITVIPLSSDRTQYDVTDVDGKVKVTADKNDVKIHYNGALARRSKQAVSSDALVREGEQGTREERCGTAERPADALAAKAGILNNPWAVGAGAVAVGVVACLGLCHTDDPISPDKP